MARTGYASPLPEHEGTLFSGFFAHPLYILLVLREIPAFVVISENNLLDLAIFFQIGYTYYPNTTETTSKYKKKCMSSSRHVLCFDIVHITHYDFSIKLLYEQS